MKILAARKFYEHFGNEVEGMFPDLQWSLLEPDGSWSSDPYDSEIAVLVADAYCHIFKETVLKIPGLHWLHTEDTGTDGVFYQKLLFKNVLLTRSAGANAPEVAEFVFAVILWQAKQLNMLKLQQLKKQWKRTDLANLSNKIILVAGLGAIGSRVAKIAKSFEMHTLGIRKTNVQVEGVDELGTLSELPDFLSRADIIVLTLPLNSETVSVINAVTLEKLKSDAMLVNVGRGHLIDIDALKVHLKQNPSSQACLDVMPEEPWPEIDELWQYPNVLLTPHLAWSSPLYRIRATKVWFENLRRYRSGQPLLHLVSNQ